MDMQMDPLPHDERTTGSQDDVPLSKMPIEWLIQVLQWLPTQYLFTIMCVNREWECAVRYIIKTRESLALVLNEVDCLRDRYQKYWITLTGRDMNNLSMMQTSVMQMRHLTCFAHHPNDRKPDGDTISDFIRQIMIQNAATLREIVCHQLPDDASVKFPRLTKLDCNTLDVNIHASLCPRLEELSVREAIIIGPQDPVMPSLKFFKSPTHGTNTQGISQFLVANAATLQSIEVHEMIVPKTTTFASLEQLVVFKQPQHCFFPVLQHLKLDQFDSLAQLSSCLPSPYRMISIDVFMRIPKESDVGDACNFIARMSNLKRIAIRGLVEPDQESEEAAADPAPVSDYPDLFADMNDLEDAVIRTVDWIDGGLQQAKLWPSSLIRNNPKLRKLHLFGILVTDADLILCSQLEHLSHVNLGYRMDGGFTIAGVRALLRGNSRSNITQFCLWADEDMIHDIDKEFDQIQQERNFWIERLKSFISRKVGIDAKYFVSPFPVRDSDVDEQFSRRPLC